MINNIYFAIGCLAILYVIYWAIKNDQAERIKDQVGLLRMPPPTGDRQAKPVEPWRPGQSPRQAPRQSPEQAPGRSADGRWQRPVKRQPATAEHAAAAGSPPPIRRKPTHEAE